MIRNNNFRPKIFLRNKFFVLPLSHKGIASTASYLFLGAVFCLLLSACGVKSVGDDVTPHTPSGLRSSAYSPTDARYPVTGNRIEARLYMLNHPTAVMARQNYVQASIREQYNRAHGLPSTPANAPFGNSINHQALDPMGFTTESPVQSNTVSPFR